MAEQTHKILNTTVKSTHRISFTLNILVNMNMVNFKQENILLLLNSVTYPKALCRGKNTMFRPNIWSNSVNDLL